ncbi:hypothetical protein HK100_010627 [Physocladia obscura]|uniref:Uncharacterized protein n=1 Tax=Physocladia obscura TaxID=109957 RepID=A0AAD5XAM7_9FUNG|nr:hypothetical protein HK100_010627 [Physocladia obscura]
MTRKKETDDAINYSSPATKSTPAITSPTLSASTVTCSTPTTQIAYGASSLPGTPSSLVSVTPTPKGVGKRQADFMETNTISNFSIASTTVAASEQEQEEEQEQANKTEYVGNGSGTRGKSTGYDELDLDLDQHD